MITRLEVDGFKSLQGFAVDLEPFTVFIGPNGAGKSNILEALALLSRLAIWPIREVVDPSNGWWSTDHFSRFGGEVAQEIRFAVEFLLFGEEDRRAFPAEGSPTRVRYELTIAQADRSRGDELVKQYEKLAWIRPGEDAWIIKHPEFARFAVYAQNATHKVDSHNTDMVTLDPPSLKKCRWIQLDLANPTRPLGTDRSALGTVLHTLSPSVVGEIRADLVALVPGLAGFSLGPGVYSSGEYSFDIEFELSGGEIVPAHLISSGTLRILKLLTELRRGPRPLLIGIDHPEINIYLGQLRGLLNLLREEVDGTIAEADGPTQILLTTHSPVILAALRNHPQHLRYVDTVHRDLRRVTRAREVGEPSKDPRHVVSLRDIDRLLSAVSIEDAE
jgi:predicted ATPase